MELKTLSVKGLRSFKKEQKLDFTKYKSGLYYVTGKNLVEPELGANGCGKSSLFEALAWNLYNKLSTKVTAGNVANWDGKNKCEVSIELDNMFVKRTWKPNSFSCGEKDNLVVTVQEDFEKKIGMNFASFLYSVYISQFSTKFFDLDPAVKLSIFSDIISNIASKWDDYSEASKLKFSETDKLRFDNGNEITLIDGRLSTLKNQDYKTICDTWEKERKIRSNNYTRDLSKYRESLKDLNKSKKDLEDKLKNIDKEVDKYKKSLIEISASYAEKEKEYNPIEKKANALVVDVKVIDANLKKLDGVGNFCANCNQTVPASHIQKEKTKLLKDKTVAENEINKLIKTLDTLGEVLDTYSDKKKQLEKSLSDFEYNKREINNSIRTLDVQIRNTEAEINTFEKRLNDVEKEINPYQKNLDNQQKGIKALTRYLKTLNEEKELLELDTTVYKYWTKGFKDIKLMVIKEALDELEIYINSELSKLGLSNWQILLKIDADTKSGTVKRGFIVYVKSPYNKDLVPFDCWSGGERQRLLLAGTLGLIDFIDSRKGSALDVEIYDEPSQFLSGEGIDDMLETLAERAETVNKRIFLIDHRDFATFGKFKGTISVIKDKEGSHIQQ